MRYFLNVLFVLAILPAVAKAAPFAEYNPATGDIRIREVVSVFSSMWLVSTSGALNPDVLDAPLETVPAGVGRPTMTLEGPTVLNMSVRGGRFPFTSLTIRGAFLPGTPVSDVSYFDTYRVTTVRQGTVVEVPEPATLATGGIGLLSLAALRRRK